MFEAVLEITPKEELDLDTTINIDDHHHHHGGGLGHRNPVSRDDRDDGLGPHIDPDGGHRSGRGRHTGLVGHGHRGSASHNCGLVGRHNHGAPPPDNRHPQLDVNRTRVDFLDAFAARTALADLDLGNYSCSSARRHHRRHVCQRTGRRQTRANLACNGRGGCKHRPHRRTWSGGQSQSLMAGSRRALGCLYSRSVICSGTSNPSGCNPNIPTHQQTGEVVPFSLSVKNR
mmetsp:Transcript_62764/g.86288  ORF Transcript_62764/g.86288 Transcript_62764/m.86288 type:complete len:230 (+) Transcript_62764:310-999(+)